MTPTKLTAGFDSTQRDREQESCWSVPLPPSLEWLDGRPTRTSFAELARWVWKYRPDAIPPNTDEMSKLEYAWALLAVFIRENQVMRRRLSVEFLPDHVVTKLPDAPE